MQANWSLVLNVLLLIGVVVAIGRMMKARRQKLNLVNYQPSIGQPVNAPQDDIIAVRKVMSEMTTEEPVIQPVMQASSRPYIQANKQPAAPVIKPVIHAAHTYQEERKPPVASEPGASLMLFLLAKENRQLAGYELLQTVLAAGLRFGEGHLFHRHQSPNGQGPVLCSLAAATPSGVFDMQNIGAFSVHGLCLFMHTSGNSTIDNERFSIMLDTAKQLSDGLDTYLLDDKRQPLTDASIQRYYQSLNYNEAEACEESALA
jgi:cell division protein ZipA